MIGICSRAVSDQIESILLAIGAAATRKTAQHDAVASCKPSDKVDARRSSTRRGGRLCTNAGGFRLDHSYGYALTEPLGLVTHPRRQNGSIWSDTALDTLIIDTFALLPSADWSEI